MDFVDEGPAAGTPQEYAATVTLTREPGADPETRTIRVNEPLSVGGTLVHVLNPGYAPVVTVRDADGEVLFTGPVPFLPQDDAFTSTGIRPAPELNDVPRTIFGDSGDAKFYDQIAWFPEGRSRMTVPFVNAGMFDFSDGLIRADDRSTARVSLCGGGARRALSCRRSASAPRRCRIGRRGGP